MPNPTRPLEIICTDPSDCDAVVPVRERGPIPTLCPRHKHLKKLADTRAQYAADTEARGVLDRPEPKPLSVKQEATSARLARLETQMSDLTSVVKRLVEYHNSHNAKAAS